MKFLCIVCFAPEVIDQVGPDEWSRIGRDSMAYDQDLERRGHFIDANALQSAQTATTVRSRNGEMLVTDGPFAETKEHIAGYILIDAESREQAQRLAADIPLARLGSVEVRPVMEF